MLRNSQSGPATQSAHLPTDGELVTAIAGGSADALAALYDRHIGLVYSLARRITQSSADAEEVVQDVFLQINRDAPRYVPGRAAVLGWMVTLTRTRAIDRLRWLRTRPRLDGGLLEGTSSIQSPLPDPEQTTVAAEDSRRVRSALDALPVVHRRLLALAHYEDLSHAEIARRLAMPLGTVKTRIRAALSMMRAHVTLARPEGGSPARAAFAGR